jgi:hypothetical protein
VPSSFARRVALAVKVSFRSGSARLTARDVLRIGEGEKSRGARAGAMREGVIIAAGFFLIESWQRL